MTRPKNVVREEEIPWMEMSHGERVIRRKMLAKAAGGEKIGCSLYAVPPGERTFPYHFHHVNEEAVFILEGEGTLRLAGGQVAVKAGDYVVLPVGPAGAHQIRNTGTRELRFLCLSTMESPEVSEYPDSGKLGIFVGSAPGGAEEKRLFTGFFRKSGGVDYWEGEE